MMGGAKLLLLRLGEAVLLLWENQGQAVGWFVLCLWSK